MKFSDIYWLAIQSNKMKHYRCGDTDINNNQFYSWLNLKSIIEINQYSNGYLKKL